MLDVEYLYEHQIAYDFFSLMFRYESEIVNRKIPSLFSRRVNASGNIEKNVFCKSSASAKSILDLKSMHKKMIFNGGQPLLCDTCYKYKRSIIISLVESKPSEDYG